MSKFLVLLIFSLIFLISSEIVFSSTLEGTIYNKNLEAETNVLLTINTIPEQHLLSKEGTYILNIPPGTYTLSAQKGNITISNTIKIEQEGEYTYDIFLLLNIDENEDLWEYTQPLTEENLTELSAENSYFIPKTVSYVLVTIIVLLLFARVIYYRKKYGSLRLFRKRIKVEQQKTTEQLRAEIASEPTILDKTIEIIKKHDGRIHQTKLRCELNYLSEAKVSLIITELEHKGKIEKIKKGRGNIIIFKE